MKKKLAINAAIAALAISLGGAAHAQQADPNAEAPVVGAPEEEASSEDGITPYYGTINPFYGTINPFYGDIDAFWGHINPFYGNINPFYGTINPFYGDIDAFWGDIDAFYGDIIAFDSSHLDALGQYGSLEGQQIQTIEALFNGMSHNADGSIKRDGTPNRIMTALGGLIAHGRSQFGETYTAKTGNSFDVLVDEIFARHGADPNNKATIEVLTVQQRAALYMDWHDTMMGLSGIDHIDHWMAAVNWRPAITRQQGSGADSLIGIIDGSFTGDTDLADNLVWVGGSTNTVGGHGAGVASLIAGAHDGEGVMGIAPNAKIAAYNPFPETGGASWQNVIDGIVALKSGNNAELNAAVGSSARASVINMSLGQPGWMVSQGLADVFANPNVAKHRGSTVYVVAAGNHGVTQTQNVDWDFASDPALILVGSVNPLGEISSFSNRPGDSCLLDNGVCDEENRAYMRTIVAPGELLLMSDGKGGVVRRSGTSFAAPLVSGAITLLHDRWPWLAQHPKETTEIIFRSARDLGAPGPDEVYGWGLLDVEASQSPLDFNDLVYYRHEKSLLGGYVKTPVSAQTLLNGGVNLNWELGGVFFTMFETIGNTERDFAIPVSSLLYGTQTDATGNLEYFQQFAQQGFEDWLGGNGNSGPLNGALGMGEMRSSDREVQGGWTLQYDAMRPRLNEDGTVTPMHSAATLVDPRGKMTVTLGYGQGAMALGGGRFGLASDHNAVSGGVNPVLGFASGETFASASFKPNAKTTVSVGYSENRADWDDMPGLTSADRAAYDMLDEHTAHAFTVDVERKIGKSIAVNAQYTRLEEDSALLGTQSTATDLLGRGTSTDAMTLAAAIDVGSGLSFDLSATAARTSAAKGQAFTTPGGVWSSAAQVTASKRGVLGKRDVLRLSVAQPLNIEAGKVEYRSAAVVDRSTGEIGDTIQAFGIEGKRRIAGEAIYAAPMGEHGEFGLFGRYETGGDASETKNYVVGGNVSLRF